MFANLRLLLRKKNLNGLISNIPSPQKPLRIRILWLFEVIEWIKKSPRGYSKFGYEATSTPAQRMALLLDLLDQNLEQKTTASRVLRSIVHETHGLELFTQTGMLKGDHVTGEFFSRLMERFPLRAPEETELHYIFKENIRNPEDIKWLELLDSKSLSRIIDLFNFEVLEEEKNWNTLLTDAKSALLLLSLRFQGLGLSSDIRKRISERDFQNLAFYDLPNTVRKFISEEDSNKKANLGFEISQQLQDSKAVFKEVRQHLNQNGVSVAIVYKMERLESIMRRMEDLLILLRHQPVNQRVLSEFIAGLVLENIDRSSVSHLIKQNFQMLARKIVERTGETGEHYITRTPAEHLMMVRSAIGGGWMTAFTTVFKFLIFSVGLPTFSAGLLGALNYSVSFLAIQFSHFTLGTKQPSMTAASLAAEMNGNLKKLVDEVLNIIRSQFAAIIGNIIGVVPTTVIVWVVYNALFKGPLVSPEKAHHILEEFSVFGPTPVFAYFTGVLLWASSIFSGWVDNWFVFNKLSLAIASHRNLNLLIGPKKAKLLGEWTRKHILGIAASVSLGCLLALAPIFCQAFGLDLEVRHVTLSSGAITAAMMSLPTATLQSQEFWLAVGGIFSMAILNVGVAFGLALMTAINARGVKAPTRRLIYKSVVLRILTKPSLLFWPSNDVQAIDELSVE
jgi:site-specific recombinase